MKRHISLIIILVMGLQLWTAMAQRQLSEEDRQRWTQKMRQYKHDFLIKELDLTREQQNEFFPLYDAMEDEVNSLTIQTRELESKIAASERTSDVEYSSAARTFFEQKGKEAEIEMMYFEKFENILTPRQIFKLRAAERHFTGRVLRHHGRLRAPADRDSGGRPPRDSRR